MVEHTSSVPTPTQPPAESAFLLRVFNEKKKKKEQKRKRKSIGKVPVSIQVVSTWKKMQHKTQQGTIWSIVVCMARSCRRTQCKNILPRSDAGRGEKGNNDRKMDEALSKPRDWGDPGGVEVTGTPQEEEAQKEQGQEEEQAAFSPARHHKNRR